MSPFCPQLSRPQLAPLITSVRGLPFAALFALALGCAPEGDDDLPRDGSFGVPIDFSRNGGMDAGSTMDASFMPGPTVRVRFMHGFPNLGPLTLCHDPDGLDGPDTAYELMADTQLLRADFRSVSAPISVPQLGSGVLTLHGDPMLARGDAGLDAGPSDGGANVPCATETREAVVPLPLPDDWIAPLAESSLMSGYDPRLRTTIERAAELTLLGSGLALNDNALAQRADQVRRAFLAMYPGDVAGAERQAREERARLEAAFGPRVLFQAPPPGDGAQTFSLSLLHAIPNLTGADAGTDSEAIRLCVRAGTVVRDPFPRMAFPGVPFRMRAPLELELEAREEYTFQVFAQSEIDRDPKHCATSLQPIAKRTEPVNRFRPGGRYTLALVGVVSAQELCSPNSRSFVRAPCPRPAMELSPRLEILEE